MQYVFRKWHFWLHVPLGNVLGNELDPASDAVFSSLYTFMVAKFPSCIHITSDTLFYCPMVDLPERVGG